jgi:signal transduction histidine kinase/ligand-binding sensor domain-containing protein
VRRIALYAAVACALTAWGPQTLALDPTLDVVQYAHTAWKIRDGFAKSYITAFAQTPDGYLWLGTEFGLLRFDGVRNVTWQPPAGMALPNNRIRALLATRDGTLWIGTWGGLASWDGSRLIQYPPFDGRFVNALVEDREGTVWVGGSSPDPSTAFLCQIRGEKTDCHGEDGSLGAWTGSLHEDGKGALWVTGTNRVWRWKPGPPSLYSLPDLVGSLQTLSETDSGEILILSRSGIRQIIDGKVEEFPLPPLTRQVQPIALLSDRDGAIWIGTGSGLLHFHERRMDTFAHSNDLSGDSIVRMFEDREGNVWVATLGGIDRFRAFAATTLAVGQGLSGIVSSVLPDRDGSIWLSTTVGLHRWHDGRMTVYRARRERSSAEPFETSAQLTGVDEIVARGLPDLEGGSLFQDGHGRIWLGSHSRLGYLDNGRFVSVSGIPIGYIDGIAEDSEGNLWIAHRDAGLLRLALDRKVQQVPWTTIGHSGLSRLAADPVHGGLWLGFFSGGIVHFIDGQARTSYSAHEGLGKGRVNDVRVAADGTVWAATDGGLSRLKAGHIATLNSRSGLPCDAVDSTIDDDDASTWLYTACGLVRIARSDLDAWAVAVDQGEAPQRIRVTVLDSSDGVRSAATLPSFVPHVAKSRDGKLWFVTYDGVTVINPRHLPFNKLPPPVHIEQITADRQIYEASSNLRLPPLIHDLQIDYTALSLVAPEKILFRYKLEGRDRDWQNPGNRRRAFYVDLSPGQYRFRVIASNNSGVWNEQGDVLEFSIAPAYWQTNWFRALCVTALLALLWSAYWARMRHLRQQFNRVIETRVAERTRIARELHDTLLQSFHGLLLRFQAASEMFATRPAEAKQTLDRAIDQAAQAITEGREAVQGLRASVVESNDLAVAIRTFGEELAAEQAGGRSVVLQVVVEGTPRTLHPIQRDEIYRIACEALRNAFKHAEATQIEVELRYDERQLRLRVRDDGKGIDPQFLSEEGRAGHYGLHGMRERAKLMDGRLTVWSALDSGAEVELTVPAARAYASSAFSWRSWFGKKFSGETVQSEP